MQNLDKRLEQKQAHVNAIVAAFRENSEDKLKEAFENYQDFLTAVIRDEAEGMTAAADNTILSARGQRALTSEETKFYQSVIDATKSGAPMQAVNNITEAIPKTVIEDVLSTVRKEHPLLDKIGIRNTTGLTKWILDDSEAGGATWNELGTAVTKEAAGTIKVIDLMLCKLTAFFTISNDFLDLGPSWLDTYIRQVLTEYIAVGLEAGIVAGDGNKKPTGMNRNLDSKSSDTYAKKEAIAVNDFSKETIGTVLTTLAKDRKGNPRTVENLILVVNPLDYFSIVFPATTMLTPGGAYANNVFPYPVEIIQSAAVDQGEAILGMTNKYFLGLGSGKNGKIETDNGYSKFLDDVTTYKAKLYGNGMPYDNNSFVVLNISNVKPTYATVKTIAAAGE